jgi:regulator of protease activity HflC (stomatin/prohibitin superfamily)
MLLDRVIDFISIAAWLLLAIFIITYLIRTTLQSGIGEALRKLFGLRFLYLVFLVIVAISLFGASLVFIEPQNVGVVVSLLAPEGYRDRPMRSGLHWIVPLLEEVTRYPISWQTYTMAAKPLEGQNRGNDAITARTSDGQEVALDCSIIFQIDPEQVVRVHIDWQERYIEDFIRPTVRGLVRTQVSQYTVDEVNSSKRMDLELDLDEQTREWLSDKGFILDHFVLRNIAFSPEYAAAVEQKQVALQQAIQKEHEADQIRKLAAGEADKIITIAEADAEATRIKAQAEADALRWLAEALKLNPDLVTLRYVDKLAPGIQVMLVPNDNPYILPLPTMGTSDQPTATPSPTSRVTPAPTETSLPTPTTTPAP